MKTSIFCSLLLIVPFGLVGQEPAGSNVPGPDRAFAIMAAETDMAELQISKMALEKSESDQVKKIAQKLIDDHTKTSDAMKEIAAKKNLPLPQKVDSKHAMLAAKLEKESGATFDRDYLKANSADHHRVVAAFEKEVKSGQDSDIKSFAKEYLPAIQEHTKMIDGAM